MLIEAGTQTPYGICLTVCFWFFLQLYNMCANSLNTKKNHSQHQEQFPFRKTLTIDLVGVCDLGRLNLIWVKIENFLKIDLT